MSKRKAKQRRSIETPKAQGQTEPKPRDRTWSITFLTATPALLVGVVVIWLMLGVTSSLSAIRIVEWQELRPLIGHLWRDGFKPNVYEKQPFTMKREALSGLLMLQAGLDEGYVVRSVALKNGRRALDIEPDNLLARLLYACIVDEQLTADNTDAAGRYASFEKIVAGQKPARFATLYNDESLSLWHEYLAKSLKRPDVAASLVGCYDWTTINEHMLVLPKLQQRLNALAEQLRSQGREEYAEQLRLSFAECLAMLMHSEHGVGTQLLCADLLSKEFDQNSEPARRLQALRTDFRIAAESAPIDIFDQSGVKRYALAPSIYNRSLYSLVATLVCLSVAAGASLLFVITVIIAPSAAQLRKDDAPKVQPKRRSLWLNIAWAFAPIAIANIIVLPHFCRGIFFSEAWMYVAAIVLTAFGAFAAMAVATLAVDSEPLASRRRIVLSTLPAILAAVFFLLPASTIAWICRSIDLSIGTPVVLLVPCIAIAIAVGLFTSPARMRHLAAHAAHVMLISTVLGLAVWGYHHVADGRYQQSVVSFRFDEITARLGEGWQASYLKPAFDACGVPLQ